MEHQFTHSKTYRYRLLHGDRPVKKVLYVLHGYGHLIEYFIWKFQKTPEDLLIVAPEGMHRFYLKGTEGHVGASWMTKEARETDIEDTISYLNELDKQISSSYPIKKRYLLGFSQGGATAARWEQLGTVKFDALILWACVFPPDLNPWTMEKTASRNHFFVMGSEDEFFSTDKQQKLVDHYDAMGYQIIPYLGKHDLNNETLTKILGQIETNS
ncbi:MAG: putative esterase [Crocinitomicaceae bacterium]|jgi:predicted esterase